MIRTRAALGESRGELSPGRPGPGPHAGRGPGDRSTTGVRNRERFPEVEWGPVRVFGTAEDPYPFPLCVVGCR